MEANDRRVANRRATDSRASRFPPDYRRSIASAGSRGDQEIRDIIVAIRNRRLWKKSLVISRSTVPEAMHNNAGGPMALYGGIVKLAGNDPEKILARRQIAAEICEEAHNSCRPYE